MSEAYFLLYGIFHDEIQTWSSYNVYFMMKYELGEGWPFPSLFLKHFKMSLLCKLLTHVIKMLKCASISH